MRDEPWNDNLPSRTPPGAAAVHKSDDQELSLILARQSFYALDNILSLLPPDTAVAAADIGALTRLIKLAATQGH